MIQYQSSAKLSQEAPSATWTTDDRFPRNFDFSTPSFAFTAELAGYTEKSPEMNHVKLPERIGDLAIFFHANPHCFTELTFPRFSEAWFK